MPIGPMKCCMLGVSRKGTASGDAMRGWPAVFAGMPGRTSLSAIWPEPREMWKRDGVRLERASTYVMKLDAAIWSVNSLRKRHSSVGPLIVRRKYCEGLAMPGAEREGTYAGDGVLWHELRADLVEEFLAERDTLLTWGLCGMQSHQHLTNDT